MYESPIKIIQDQIQMEMENGIMKAVQRYNIDVDKEELLKALQYDRDQYSKGYEDGLNANKWIPISERLPETDGEYLCWCKGSFYACACVRKFAIDLYLIDKFEFKKESGAGFYYYESDWGYFKEEDVIAWMHFPEPYKGVEE